MDENVTGLLTQNGRLGNARIGASDPEHPRFLALSQRREELWVGLGDIL